MKKQTEGFVELLGEGDAGEAASLLWVVCDPRNPLYGKTLPDGVVEDEGCFVSLGSRAVVNFEGSLRFCERIDAASLETALRDWKPDGGDCRILAVARDAADFATDCVAYFAAYLTPARPRLGLYAPDK